MSGIPSGLASAASPAEGGGGGRGVHDAVYIDSADRASEVGRAAC